MGFMPPYILHPSSIASTCLTGKGFLQSELIETPIADFSVHSVSAIFISIATFVALADFVVKAVFIVLIAIPAFGVSAVPLHTIIHRFQSFLATASILHWISSGVSSTVTSPSPPMAIPLWIL
jgi:hypothetical protein